MNTTAVLFPGQGSQIPQMGRDVAEMSRDAMDYWKLAERISDLPLRGIYWEECDPERMADTRALQPALTVVCVNLWRLMADKCKPATVAGHSLGEYAAMTCAGALDAQDALQLVSLRGRLMAEADPDGRGTMAAVLKMAQPDVEDVVNTTRHDTGEMILIANYNTPGQLVISGTKPAVEHALGLIKERKGRAIPLSVSGAFHSPLMAEASKTLQQALRKIVWRKPHFPVYGNVTAKPAVDGESVREAIMEQMTSSVQWIATMRQQWQDGIRTFVEVGPKPVLSKMVQPCLADLTDEAATVSTVTNAEEATNF